MDALEKDMVQMLHDAVEEIKQGIGDCIDVLEDHIIQKCVLFDS